MQRVTADRGERVVWAVLCAFLLAACSDATVVVGRYASGHADASPDASTSMIDVAMQARDPLQVMVEEGELRDFCARRGPPLRVAPLTRSGCSAGIGRRLFAQALCSCADLESTGAELAVDSFDSATQTVSAHETGAAISVNGSLQALAASSTLLGSLSVAAGGLPRFAGKRLLVAGDVKLAGPLLADSGEIAMLRDLWLDGAIRVTTPVRVGRDLYWTSSAALPSMLQVVGRTERRALAWQPPCACAAQELLDVGAITRAYRDVNDNASAKLDSGALDGVLASLPLELACGRYSVGSVNVLGNAVINVHGRTVLSVAGDFSVSGNLSVNIDPGAELDLFVGGDFRLLVGLSSLGHPERPSALRIYVAGSQRISLLGLTSLAAQIYAPRAAVEIGGLDSYGSVFANGIVLSGDVHHHYDRAVLGLGDAGSCDPCHSDAECAQPLVCADGSCQPLLLPL